MKHTGEKSSKKICKVYDKMIETSSLTSIILSHMLMNALPYSVREKMERLRHNSNDRRHDRRYHVDRIIAYVHEGNDLKKAHMINISKGGIYLEVDATPDVGQEMSFSLSSKNLWPFMWVKGRVMRKADRGLAIRFI